MGFDTLNLNNISPITILKLWDNIINTHSSFYYRMSDFVSICGRSIHAQFFYRRSLYTQICHYHKNRETLDDFVSIYHPPVYTQFCYQLKNRRILFV